MSNPLRVYYDPSEIGPDGYPLAWHRPTPPTVLLHEPPALAPIKDLIRERDGHRCLRCHHPYRKGQHKMETDEEGHSISWSPCDGQCRHGGPMRLPNGHGGWIQYQTPDFTPAALSAAPPDAKAEASWRILTVHHLNGIKHDCRWWNLVSLCQACHLRVQGRVQMDRVYPHPHSEWFKPFVAAYYAWVYLGQELSREEVDERLEELLNLELDPSYRDG